MYECFKRASTVHLTLTFFSSGFSCAVDLSAHLSRAGIYMDMTLESETAIDSHRTKQHIYNFSFSKMVVGLNQRLPEGVRSSQDNLKLNLNL